MSVEVSFEVDVSRIGKTYGLTLCLHEGEESEDGDPCFLLVFDGPPGYDPVDTARLFVTAHQDAMESVGLGGEMTEEAFEDKLEHSIELAGELMMRHGFEAKRVDDVDPGILAALFAEEPEQDPKLLN